MKKSTTIRVSDETIESIKKAHPEYIAKTKKVISLTKFTDHLILVALRRLRI